MHLLSSDPSVEHAASNERRMRPVAVFAGVSLISFVLVRAAFAAGVLPQGGQYIQGKGSIASSGNSLVITQPGSSRGVIDWNSFSIGRHNRVTFDGCGANSAGEREAARLFVISAR
jgi:hypothetical protein